MSFADPRLRLLTGAETADLLCAAVDGAGGRLVRWSVRDVDYRPSGRTTASYRAVVAWPDGERAEMLAASTPASRSAGGLVLSDGEHDVQVWRFPADPELPVLAAACDPAAVAGLLRGLGVVVHDVEPRVVAYRPRKRAVVEVRAGRHRFFLKVLRPARVAAVDQRHRLLTGHGVAVPRSLGWSDDGLIVLEPLPGHSMRSALDAGTRTLPSPADVTNLLDRLPAGVAELPRRRPWATHAAHYAGIVAAACPAIDTRVRALGAEIESLVSTGGDGEQPTHGDFYEAQLFVAGSDVTGLLDIDTVGPGRRADDLACLLAHLSVLATMDVPAAAVARRVLATWLPAFAGQVDRRDLCARAAGVTLSLATGPFRVREPGWPAATTRRVALAESWLSENPLIELS